MLIAKKTQSLLTAEFHQMIRYARTTPIETLDRSGISDDPREFRRQFGMAMSKYKRVDGASVDDELSVVEADIAICRRYRSGPAWKDATAEENARAERAQVEEYVQYIIMERIEPTIPHTNEVP